jgi:hypothetical protein
MAVAESRTRHFDTIVTSFLYILSVGRPMADLDELGERTRRAVLKALGGTAGLAAAGQASAHGWGESSDQSNLNNTVENGRPETQGLSENARVHGYHSLGGAGPSGETGTPEAAHSGGIVEIRVRGNYLYQSMFSSRGETSGRALAIIDASEFIEAETEAELEAAELTVESFFSNLNPATAIMDLKVDDTGDFVFLGTQPILALYNEVGFDSLPTNVDPQSLSGPNTGSVIAVDVSDKSNPQLADASELFTTGIHNVFHHRIDGDDYVFACKDIESDGTAGMYVFRFNRTLGLLVPVNRWTPDGNGTELEVGVGGAEFYCHDVTIQDDPKTGTPTIYLHYWDAGLIILDASDPTSLEQIGVFPMLQSHFAVPAPDTITDADGTERRVAFASHEEPSVDPSNPRDGKPNPGSTGTIYLVDTDDIYETDGVVECGELANWTWQDQAAFSNYDLSPHNSDPAIHDGELWLHVGHYHGGTRFLKVEPGADRGTTVSDEPELGGGIHVTTNGGLGLGVGDWNVVGLPNERANDATDWALVEKGFSRPVEDVPESSKVGGLSTVQPYVWSAVESRGVTFSSDINQGVFASHHDDIPLEGPVPDPDVERDLGGLVGEDVAVPLRVESDRELLVRDRVPSPLGVETDAGETYPLAGRTAVEFRAGPAAETLDYRLSVPSAVDAETLTFGPVEVSDDGGTTWHAISGTIGSPSPAPFGSGLPESLGFGTAAGATAVTYRQRERLRAGFARLFGDGA